MKELTTKRREDGTVDFFYGRKNITALWMDFFSGLSMEDERNCTELFLKKYGKTL